MPSDGEAITILPGLALACAIRSATPFAVKRRIGVEHEVDAVDRRHRRDVAHEVVAEVLHQRRVDGVRRRGEEQRVAVGRRPHHRFGAERAAGAGPVLDHDGLAQLPRQPLRGKPRDDVDLAAGRETDDQLDRASRIGLREGVNRDDNAQPQMAAPAARRKSIAPAQAHGLPPCRRAASGFLIGLSTSAPRRRCIAQIDRRGAGFLRRCLVRMA